MAVDDGPADRQPHAHAAGLRRVEGFENPLEVLRIDARSGIAHGDADPARLELLGADRQLARSLLHGAHGLDGVQDQVHDHLLQLNPIALDRNQAFGRAGTDRDVVLGDCALHHDDHFVDRLVDVDELLSRRRLLDVLTHAIDDSLGAVRIPDHAGERFLDFAEIRGFMSR